MIRKVVILQGTSGSGKSTWARAQPDTRIVSADDAIVDPDGVYRFTPEKQALGHKNCLRAFAEHLYERHGKPTRIETLIVDNTNTRAFFMAPYVALALSYDVPVEILSFRAPLEVCAMRNSGRAPEGVIREMIEAIGEFTVPEQWTKNGVVYTIVETG